jgi:Zn-finger nucleic acid-binding protein
MGKFNNMCPDCGAKVGELHDGGCDIERCPRCGGQFLACGCKRIKDADRIIWSGEKTGIAECREYGFYTVFRPGRGFVQSDRNHPEAIEDLNRLFAECVWDKKLKKFVLPE